MPDREKAQNRRAKTSAASATQVGNESDFAAIVQAVLQELAEHADRKRQEIAKTYFPTAMRVLGVPVPHVRNVARKLSQEHKSASPEQVLGLAFALVEDGSMEGRQVAYELIERHKATALHVRKPDIERLRKGLDNWASVDSFAASVAGPAWRRGQIDDALLFSWGRSPDRFVRRLSLVCTVALNMRSRGGKGDVGRTLALCTEQIADRDEFVVKALSWALRELFPHDEAAVRAFLATHDGALSKRVIREVKNKLATGRKNGAASVRGHR